MRILLVTATYPPSVNGVAYHVQLLKAGLERRGHQVLVLAPRFPGFTDSEKGILRYPSLPNPFVKSYPLGVPLVSSGKIEDFRPQVVHTHHPLIVGRFAAGIAARLSLPLFFTAHTQYHQYLNYYFPRGYDLTSKVLSRDLRDLAKKCHTVICPSPQTKEQLSGLGITNTRVVFNGIETGLFSPPQRRFVSRPTLVFTGRIQREKNPLFLIKLAAYLKKHLPHFRLYIAGSGSLLPKMAEGVEKFQLGENVQLLGDVPRKLLPHLYAQVHLFVTPSRSDVMPLSILEALSCGLPVVGLEKSNLESIVLEGKTGFLLPANPRIVGEKIMALLKGPGSLSLLSREARRFSLQFSVDRTARQIARLYERAAEVGETSRGGDR